MRKRLRRGAAKLFLIDVKEGGLRERNCDCDVEPVIGSVADEALWDALEPKLSELDHVVVNAGIGSGGVDTAIRESSPDFPRSLEAQGREAVLKAKARTTPLRRLEGGFNGS